MAYTELTLQASTRIGLEATYASGDSANGHSFDNATENVCIHVLNGGASSINVTVVTPGTIDGIAITDMVVAVPASEERIIGPFANSLYGQVDADNSIDEAVGFDLSDDTSVTLAAIKLGLNSY